ncbi:MAG: NAD-dependent epimerase [Aeromicrobium sp.]|nr:NAD-dependent epimerase [Burkholderiales bacterium]
MKILVTGAAGFIGHALSQRLLAHGDTVVGVDNLNDYYDVSLKEARLAQLTPHAAFSFLKTDIADKSAMEALFASHTFDAVVNLAAQAGVRHSLVNPHVYVEANLQGFVNILEGCRHQKVGHLVFASTSSVYGLNSTLPFDESQTTDHPVSLYAATKKANELMAHSYAHLFGIPMTGLRFFTVYGPWGRPDMALFKFTKAILAGETIQVFNHGKMVRDFTYIDDIVEGVMRVIDRPAAPAASWSSAKPTPATSSAPYRIFNIGNNQPVELMRYIHAIELATGKPAKMEMLPIQPGDVHATAASVERLEALTGFKPETKVEDGVAKFVDWFRGYYGRS